MGDGVVELGRWLMVDGVRGVEGAIAVCGLTGELVGGFGWLGVVEGVKVGAGCPVLDAT